MQIPILSGIYTNTAPDFRIAYPVNLVPVPVDNGISQGYLRPIDGLVEFAEGPGPDRGGINWNNKCYRVMGSRLVRVDGPGAIVDLGGVNPGTYATFDYSFDRLSVSIGSGLFYYNETIGVVQVLSEFLGPVIDHIWVDGYFMTTDGESIVVTDIDDPMVVLPFAYASSEADPDPIVALKKLRNEPCAINRYTIEKFANIGVGVTPPLTFFPFQRIQGAQIQKGAVGTKAVCIFAEMLAFLGGGRNEPVAIYLGINSNTEKLSTHEIDLLLAEYTEQELSESIIEERLYRNNHRLYVHLPDRTIVYDLDASRIAGTPVWYILTSSLQGFSPYRSRNFVWCYNEWIGGDITTNKLTISDDSISTQLGEIVRWEFQTPILYNESKRALIHELELVALTGRVEVGSNPTISTSYSMDGMAWSQNKYISAGGYGQTTKRLCWFQQGSLTNWRIQRFSGDSQSHVAIARLEANIEPMRW